MTFSARVFQDRWPGGASPDGDYSNFGTARITFTLPGLDLRDYQRVYMEVRPRSPGQQVQHLNVSVTNDGEKKVPDPYLREGSTVFDLEGDRWQKCIWAFGGMPRDAVTSLSLFVFLSGSDAGAPGEIHYDVRNIRFEKTGETEFERGWVNPNTGIRLSSVGYFPEDRKTAVVGTGHSTFLLRRSDTGEIVMEGSVERVENELGVFQVADFSALRENGMYVLETGDAVSPAFEISRDLCRGTAWKLINFFFCLRCGTPVPGKHGTCHTDIVAEHLGQLLPYCGGWHDAGDVSQQTAQTAEITCALFECAEAVREDRMLFLRLQEEARWGLDFVLKTRFGDGYRATSAGATRFTDGKIGTFDDVKARVHNHSFENYLCAGVEAYAALCLRGGDPALSATALHAAREDFRFAEEEFALHGVHPAHMYEHTWNSGFSQYMAVRLWSASLLMQATGDDGYRHEIFESADRLLACQETGGAGLPYTGFFYRDEDHRVIVHFNHQSREHQFMQALAEACRACPDAPQREKWETGMRLYGGYAKAVSGATLPWGMLPDGVHRLDEAEDRALFPYLHVTCSWDAEKENFLEQLRAGKEIAPGHVLRRFPVWFSFRGNSAVLLSQGKAASILGTYFQDPELLQIAHEQLYWMWGKNPFGQSLVYGDGANYCRQYAVLCGESVGEVPVGIETLENEDVPYWPQNNNATFREVWGAVACRLMMLCADTLKS